MTKQDTKVEKTWRSFTDKEQLTNEQMEQFKQYASLLLEWNEKFNLTSILSLSDVVAYHFRDSLALGRFIDLTSTKILCDIGTGGGFPGIPLKIKYPSLKIILMEVSKKKIEFLEHIIDVLELKDIEICPFDWRTFLRTTEANIDYFLSRATLKTDELVRMFKPGCTYKNDQLVYWAASSWELGKKDEPFFDKEEDYKINYKKRRLIFFKRHDD